MPFSEIGVFVVVPSDILTRKRNISVEQCRDDPEGSDDEDDVDKRLNASISHCNMTELA